MTAKLLGGGIDGIEDGVFHTFDGSGEDITDLQKDVDSQLDHIFQEFGGDERDTEFKINIKRAVPGKGELEHCFACTPAELPIIERIRNEFGPGAYQIWVYKDGKIFKRRNLNIAKPRQGYVESTPRAPEVPNVGQDNSSLIMAMSENNRKMMEQMQIMMMGQNKPGPDIVSMLTGAAPLILALKEVFQPKNSSGELSTFMKAAEFMKSINAPEKEGESNFYDFAGKLASTFGGPLMELSTKMADNPLANNPIKNIPSTQGEQPMATANTNNSQIPPAQEPNSNDRQIAALKNQLVMLAFQASRGSDSLLYADLIIDQVPIEQLNTFINRPDALEFLISVEPGVGNYKQWFGELLNNIRNVITDLGDNENLTSDDPLANTAKDAAIEPDTSDEKSNITRDT